MKLFLQWMRINAPAGMSIFSCGKPEPDDTEPLESVVTRKVVVVGDGEVGKTSLLLRFVSDVFDERYEATIFDNQAAAVMVRGQKVMLSLFDTAGQEGYEYLRPCMYPETDVVLICFAVDNSDSLHNVVSMWVPEVRAHLAKVPVVLVGLKTDLRRRDSLSPDVTQSDSFGGWGKDSCPSRHHVAYEEGQKVASQIGARAYFECSAKRGEGLTPIFQETGRLSLKFRRHSTLREVWRRSSFRNLWPSRRHTQLNTSF